MCGIAGYSLARRAEVDRTLAAQALLAAIAERGGDAVGYAYTDPEARGSAVVVKQRTPASKLLEQVELPAAVGEVIVHVRAFTKGHPSIAANNHPVRHGPVVGVHNGRILNDDELLADHDCARAEPRMTVDSEAVFALAAHARGRARAFEALEGSMAAAWLDERRPEVVYLARGVGRPLWIGESPAGIFFASTEHALGVVEQYCSPGLRAGELEEGVVLALRRGKIVRRERFRPNEYAEDDAAPAEPGLKERDACLSRLALIAAAV